MKKDINSYGPEKKLNREKKLTKQDVKTGQ